MLTSGSLSAGQELLASWIAKDRNKDGNYFTSRVPKMGLYGAFISAPLGHVLISILQKVFSGRTSVKAKILQILASNLIVSRPYIPGSIKGARANQSFTDRPYSKQRISSLNGTHSRRSYNPPSEGNLASRIHARHEGQLDHLTSLSRIRSEILARTHLGSVL